MPALFAYFLCWFRESKVADRAKYQAKNNQAASMSTDEPILIMATVFPLSADESNYMSFIDKSRKSIIVATKKGHLYSYRQPIKL